jgi:hypothetical protein
MPADEQHEEFEHTPTVLNVGALKQALAAIPDDTPLEFQVADEPGSNLAGAMQIAFSAAISEGFDHQRGTYPAFVVELEFPPGTYERRRAH